MKKTGDGNHLKTKMMKKNQVMDLKKKRQGSEKTQFHKSSEENPHNLIFFQKIKSYFLRSSF